MTLQNIKIPRRQQDEVSKGYSNLPKAKGKHFWIGHLQPLGHVYEMNYPVSSGMQQS